MKTASLVAVVFAACAATALQITDPKENDQWDLSQTNTIKWTAVETDTAELDLYLVDKSTTPETRLPIAEGVKTADKQFALTNFVVARTGDRYTVKAFSRAQRDSGQLSESGTFNVTKSGVASTTTPGGNNPSGSATGSGSTPSPSNGAATLGQAMLGVVGPLAVVLAVLF